MRERLKNILSKAIYKIPYDDLSNVGKTEVNLTLTELLSALEEKQPIRVDCGICFKNKPLPKQQKIERLVIEILMDEDFNKIRYPATLLCKINALIDSHNKLWDRLNEGKE